VCWPRRAVTASIPGMRSRCGRMQCNSIAI
jgi:hypothetical protein